MTTEVYWISGSAPAWRILLALELKGLLYQSHILEASRGDQKSPDFLRLNPRGQVPVLTDGEVTVCESRAILMYLEHKYPQPPLFGETPQDTADIAQCFETILDYVDTTITQFVRPIFRNKLADSESALEKTGDKLKTEFKSLDERLVNRTWLAGEQASAADIALIPALQRFLRALNKSPEAAERCGFNTFSGDFPALHRWNESVERHPAFEPSFPPHWR